MATEPQPQVPPPNYMIPELIHPDHTETFFTELVGRQSDRFIALNPIKRGTLYADCPGADRVIVDRYPTLYFCKETVPIGSNTVAGMNQSQFVIWHWSTDENADSTYNAEISYLGDAVGNPVFARVYTVRRQVYEANPTIGTGLPLTALIGVQMRELGSSYTRANAIFDCGGINAEVEFVISKGQIISGIVTAEGSEFNPDSQITIEGDGSGATCIPLIQPPGAILTSQKKIELPDNDPLSHEFVRVLRVYELLPGPWIPFTRYDDDLGPVQGRRRAVLNTGQRGGVITQTSKTNYEGRDGSSVVLIEIQENWTDGTGSNATNPLYPLMQWATYEQVKGDVQHFSQIVHADPLQQPPDASFQRQLGKAIKTWFEPYADNPYLLKRFIDTWIEPIINDQKLIREFGGGIVNVTETIAEPGTQSPVRGLMVVSSETVQTSPDEQTLRTVKNPLSSWPPLIGHHTDEITGIVVNFVKQVIDAGTPYPGTTAQSNTCGDVIIQGPFIEDQPYDEDKTIRITSSVDLTTLPKPQCWPIHHPVNFPPQLLSVEAVWTDFSGRTTSAEKSGDVHTTFVEAKSGSNGGAAITARKGFRGYAKGFLLRQYFFGPPNAGLVPIAAKILSSDGSVIFMATSSSTNTSETDDGGISFHDQFESQAEVHQISDYLVGNFTISGSPGDVVVGNRLIHKSPLVGPITADPPFISIIAEGTPATMDVRIPQSTPTELVSGSSIIMEVDVQPHPFGIFRMDVIYVTVP